MDFQTLMDMYVLHQSNLIITGDFNIHMDIPNDPETHQFTDLLTSYELLQHVTDPTHYLGHMLDLVISRESESILADTVVKEKISDHMVIIYEAPCCIKEDYNHPSPKGYRHQCLLF